jgi:O-antigen ligase
MSNTASLRRTEAASPAFPVDRVATALAALVFTILIVSLRPFQPTGGADPEGGGDIVNQLGFGALAMVAIFSLVALADRRKVAALVSPWWVLALGFMFLSVLNASDPDAASRTAIFTLIGMLAIGAVLTLPQSADSFTKIFLFCGAIALGLSYLGVALVPQIAIHQLASSEPQLAGDWRGLFSHKNVAAPVTAAFCFAGLYVFRRGWRRSGGLLFLAAFIFMWNTGSKTTAGLVPVAIVFVVLPGIFNLRFLTGVVLSVAMIGMALGTLGIVFIEPLKHLANIYFPGLTYTGRTTIWQFAGEMLMRRPWTGYGYDSFWGTPLLLNQAQPFDRAWDVRNIVNGHDGYLDIAVIMGIPALCAILMAFIVAPILDYMRTPKLKENIYLADFFMTVLLFTALDAFLESFFFARNNPVWMFFLLACLGLRITARFPIRPSARNVAGTLPKRKGMR